MRREMEGVPRTSASEDREREPCVKQAGYGVERSGTPAPPCDLSTPAARRGGSAPPRPPSLSRPHQQFELPADQRHRRALEVQRRQRALEVQRRLRGGERFPLQQRLQRAELLNRLLRSARFLPAHEAG
jgi:hypothetical protein